MKWTAHGEQFDGGRDIYVEQEGAHVTLSVEATSGANAGLASLTPGQARSISTALLAAAEEADRYGASDGES